MKIRGLGNEFPYREIAYMVEIVFFLRYRKRVPEKGSKIYCFNR